MQVGVHLQALGQRIRHDECPGNRQGASRPGDRGDVLGTVDSPVDGASRVGEVEAREAIRAESHDGDVEGLESFERGGDIEDRLDPRADDRDRGCGERGEVCGLIPGLTCLAVDAAEATGGEDADAGQVCQMARRRHGCRGVLPAGDNRRDISDAHLDDVLEVRHSGELIIGESDAHASVEDRDGRGDGTVSAYRRFHLAGHAQVLGTGEAVADDGGFEGHHRAAGLQGSGYLGGVLQGWCHGGTVTRTPVPRCAGASAGTPRGWEDRRHDGRGHPASPPPR